MCIRVKVAGIVFPYAFASETQEWWLKDRLTNLVAVTTENGKKTEVTAKAEVDRVLVSVNGQARAVSWEVWTSSFWKLADRRFHNKDVPLLEPDTGKVRWSLHRSPAAGMEVAGYAGATLFRGKVYTGFSDGNVVAYDALTGAERWQPVDLAAEAEQIEVSLEYLPLCPRRFDGTRGANLFDLLAPIAAVGATRVSLDQ